MSDTHVLIIGAGITGLLLAQALKTHGICCTVYERDPDAHHRGKGWGLALHWALDTLLSLLPQHLQDRLPEAYVDPAATARGEVGKFPFFDLNTGETRWQVPPTKRVRVSREPLMRLLMDEIHVQWGKSLKDIARPSSREVTAHFEDGSSASGTQLVGCDGTRSRVRILLCELLGSSSENHPLPVRFMGTSVVYPSSMGRVMQGCDPFFFQGADPKTDAFMFFATQDTPANNDRVDQDTYSCQVIISWPFRAGFLARDEPTEVPVGDVERLRLMKEITKCWASPFRDVVLDIPEGTPIRSIRIEDWPPQEGAWDNLKGRATLVGDAGHAMTMYRGEAANHGITDVRCWLDIHLAVLKAGEQDSSALKAACDAYERGMVERTRLAVLASRRACLDAHDYERINDSSPLVSRRAIIIDSPVEA